MEAGHSCPAALEIDVNFRGETIIPRGTGRPGAAVLQKLSASLRDKR